MPLDSSFSRQAEPCDSRNSMCTAGVAMQDAAAAPIPHLRFGSPFDHDPAHPGGAVDGLVPDQAAEEAPLLAVLWEGVSEGEASKSETPARQSEFERGLGVVTLLVRGRNGQAYNLHPAPHTQTPHPAPHQPTTHTLHPKS